MANKKITELDQLSVPADDDMIAIVDEDASPSAKTMRITVSNLMNLAPVQSVAGQTGTVTISAGDLTDANFDGKTIRGFDGFINTVFGTTVTLTLDSTHNGTVVSIDSTNAATVTVPSSLGAGFNCSFVQKGGGAVSFVAASGVTINNRQSHTKINGQYGVASIVAYADDTFVLAGDTAA